MEPPARSTNEPDKVNISYTQASTPSLSILSSLCLSAINTTLHHDEKIIPCQALLDSGADANCLSLKLANKIGATITPTNLSVSPVGGAHLRCYGISEIEIEINQHKELLHFLVLDKIGKYEMILGLPAFMDFDIGLYYAKGYCTIHGHQVPLLKDLRNQWYSEIRSTSHLFLSPRSQHVIPVKADLPTATKTARIIPSRALLSSPLRIPNAICQSNQVNRIIIANPTNSKIEIKQNALLAYAATSHSEEVYPTLFQPTEEPPEHDPDDPTQPLVEDSIYLPSGDNHTEYTADDIHSEAHSNINTELSEEEKQTLESLLVTFKDIFALNPRSPGIQTKTKCHVPLKDPNMAPLRFPPYRVTPKILIELKKQINELVENGIIKKSTSAWAFPVVMVPKPDGTIRFCTDFSKLSDKVHYDAYPLPRIDDTLDKLAGAKYFTTCDAASGYWQIPVDEADQEKLSIITPIGTYSYLVMPMGYCNASGIFQRAMNETLDEYLFTCCLVYVDDLIIYSPTFESHLQDLTNVFSQLRKYGWKLKLSKCKFAQTTVDFLGHSVSHNKITIKEDNLKKLLAMKRPTKVKELQSLLGLTNYYKKFIQGYSYIINPLLSLLKKNTSWVWTTNHDRAFEEIISKLAKYPILRMPDFNRPFIVRTDASDFAYGSALVQTYDQIEFPIAFHSGSFLPSQRGSHWSTWKREGFSVVSAIKKWRHYLSNEKFTIVTDHESLLTILDPSKETKAIIVRWRIYLQQFQFTIKHRPGKFLVLEDSLSRSPSLMALSIPDLHSYQKTEPMILDIISILEGKGDREISDDTKSLLKHTLPYFILDEGVLYFLSHNDKHKRIFKRLVIPESALIQLLPIYHDSLTAGHHSTERTYEKLAREFWMPNMFSKVKEYCEKCHTCDQNRSFFKHNSNLIPITAHEPMELIEVDHIGPFKNGNKNQYVLSIIDTFTKKKWYYLSNTTTAEETYEILVKNIILPFGIPRTILTDQGTEFNNTLATALSKLFGIEHKFATTNPRHEATGAVERSNRTCEDMLRKYLKNYDQKSWPTYLPYLAFAENQAVSRSHSYQPDYLMFGREPRRLIDLDKKNEVNVPLEQGAKEMISEIHQAWKHANQLLEEYQNEMINKRKEELGRRIPVTFKPGNWVWLATPPSAILSDSSTKLHPKAIGPYKVLEILENENVKIQITPSSTEIVRPNQLRIAKDQNLQIDPTILKGKPNEIIIISKPPTPPTEEREVLIPPNLNIETIVGSRIKIYWPTNSTWYSCTVIGYTTSKSTNLVYYDERTEGVNPQEDFYKAPLFYTKTRKSNIDTWKLLATTKA